MVPLAMEIGVTVVALGLAHRAYCAIEKAIRKRKLIRQFRDHELRLHLLTDEVAEAKKKGRDVSEAERLIKSARDCLDWVVRHLHPSVEHGLIRAETDLEYAYRHMQDADRFLDG